MLQEASARQDSAPAANGRTARSDATHVPLYEPMQRAATDCSASMNLDCVDKHAWHLTRARPNVRHERRHKVGEARFGTSARWRGWASLVAQRDAVDTGKQLAQSKALA